MSRNCSTTLLWRRKQERAYLEDLDLDGSILEWILKKHDGLCVTLVYVTQDRAKWRAIANTVVTERGSINSGEIRD